MTRYFDAFFINENSSIKIILKDNKEHSCNSEIMPIE